MLPIIRPAIAIALWAGVALALPSTSFGQDGVASSGMGQGEANITARSDVRLRIESGPGTSGQKLQRMVQAVSAQLGEIRSCYGRTTEENPTVTGNLRIDLRIEPRPPRPQLRVQEDSLSDAQLLRCVRRHLERADFQGIARPAQVRVSLEFTNTAAEGVEQMQERSAEEGDVEVTREDSHWIARGGTPGGEVRFEVRAGRSREQAAATQRSVRSLIAGLLDCRRRAGRRGMDSEGTIRLRLSVPARGRVSADMMNSQIEDDRAPHCVRMALRRGRFEEAAAGPSELTIHFSGRAPLDVPTQP